MEQPKQNLIKILLIVNLALSACATAGVGYLAYKQSSRPDFSQMGGMRGNGQYQRDFNQSGQTPNQSTQNQ
ncbi:hypothetical protein QUF84_09380 [Fictibacillus enclensis]|uniref:hypothetical protein n=1 Tax=Fictibacillus enclensis TaxID=1017270 RepID=UPI0025A28B11|nr:hypothetical protein [Fictibacillus enclensis]MDM5337425.1 hypothetical protein [Fictibacillus enclensis]